MSAFLNTQTLRIIEQNADFKVVIRIIEKVSWKPKETFFKYIQVF